MANGNASPVRRRRRKPAVLPPQTVGAARSTPAAETVDLDDVRKRLLAAMGQLAETFAERDDAIRVIVTALLCSLNFLFVGDPGTGKTALVRCFARHVVAARCFAPGTLNVFTTIQDLIGRMDYAKLAQGVEYRKIEGRLLDCEFAFLDEVMKATSVINALLGILNDHSWDGQRIPLWSCGSATNWPEVDGRKTDTAALYDRWHLRCIVREVSAKSRRKVRRARRLVEGYAPADGTTVTFSELKLAAEQVRGIRDRMDDAADAMLDNVVQRLRKDGIQINDRRMAQMQDVLAASAWLAGRQKVSADDFRSVLWMAWNNRKEYPAAEAIVGTCDTQMTQKAVSRIDTLRKRYQDVNRGRGGQNEAAKLVDDMIAAAQDTSTLLDSDVLREQSKNDVRSVLRELKADFDKLYAKWRDRLPSASK